MTHVTTEYFEKLKDVAARWREAVRDNPELAPETLAKKGLYVRLHRDGYRLISIRTENPCGKSGSKPVKNAADVEEHRKRFDPLAHLPKNKKPEHRLQAFLIHQALLNGPEDIARMLDPNKQLVDRLWFLADEVRLGSESIRADMLFIGSKDQKTFPILVELKASRDLKTVTKQLQNMHDAVRGSEIAFSDFLKSTAPDAASRFDFNSLQKWIIWPAAARSPDPSVAKKTKQKGLKVIEFCNARELAGGDTKIQVCFDFNARALNFSVAHA